MQGYNEPVRFRGSRLVLALSLAGALSAAWAAPVVRVHRHEGVIHGVSADILERVLADAAREGDALVIYELDTPGGLVDAAERMVQQILNSKVPVAVFVAPKGAHAASAGFFLLLAGDVAAMAPFTRTGAAHPITAGGENKEGDIALKKAAEDLSALIRTTARARGRPPELAEKAVRDAVSWSAEEALEARLIDLVVADRETLVRQLDGREIVRPDGTRVTLALADATLREHALDWVERMKDVVLHPVVMALLLSIAALGIYIEFTHPGLVLPGAVGAVALLIFLYGSRILPVNYLAAALVAAGIVFFILEIKVTSYGMLGVAGTASIGLGLWLPLPGLGARAPAAAVDARSDRAVHGRGARAGGLRRVAGDAPAPDHRARGDRRVDRPGERADRPRGLGLRLGRALARPQPAADRGRPGGPRHGIGRTGPARGAGARKRRVPGAGQGGTVMIPGISAGVLIVVVFVIFLLSQAIKILPRVRARRRLPARQAAAARLRPGPRPDHPLRRPDDPRLARGPWCSTCRRRT